MKTVEWKGIKLTVIDIGFAQCVVSLSNGSTLNCRLSRDKSTACLPYCPGGCNILLDDEGLAIYLAAKLTGDLP